LVVSLIDGVAVLSI